MEHAIAATRESFEPSVWGDFFIKYEPQPLQRSQEWMRVRADKLKGDVQMLFKTCNNTVGRMILVDTLQRLGINQLFDQEIDTALGKIHEREFSSSSLHEVALRFRLLREHGLWVSPDVFGRFKGEDGSFNKDIANEPRGMLSLYNAAHLFVHGETELEEAISFARRRLESMRGSLKSPLAEQVKRALHLPLTRTCKRVETLYYIREYEQEEGYNPILAELAKLDFNLLQHVHLKELKAISGWWKDLCEYVGLSFVRDRAAECYTWSYAVFYEKEFALARMFVAKMIGLISLMDDTYDVRASIEESRKLNAAIQRWDESGISLLPEYMRKLYNALLGNFKEFEDAVGINDSYRVAYAKKAFQNLSAYYLQEAEGLHQNHKPSFKNQVKLSAMSIGVPMLSVGLMAGMGGAITKEALKWVAGDPDTVIAGATIGRFLNDITAFNQGKNRGDAASSVECYINEHGVESEVALARIGSMMEENWKTMNQARFEHRALLPAVQRVINLTVSAPFMYNDSTDAYTSGSHLKETIENLFVKPIPV